MFKLLHIYGGVSNISTCGLNGCPGTHLPVVHLAPNIHTIFMCTLTNVNMYTFLGVYPCGHLENIHVDSKCVDMYMCASDRRQYNNDHHPRYVQLRNVHEVSICILMDIPSDSFKCPSSN